MKTKLLLIVFLLNISCILIAQIIHVPNDQPTIQDGINAANNGDTVLVAEDTYYENINFKGKAITVASNFILYEDTTHINNTIIDGSQPLHPDSASVVYFISGEDTNSIIQGFTITGGKGTYLPATRKGGGGILCYYSGAKILNNCIERDSIINEEEGINILGGGLYYFADNEWNDHLVIMYNKFKSNYLLNTASGKGAFGSAFAITCPARIIGNKVEENVAESNKTRASLYCVSPPTLAQLEISDNTISNNKVIATGSGAKIYGSGLYVRGNFGNISNNHIEYNLSETDGICYGALYVSRTDTTFIIENNIIHHNAFLYASACIGGGISMNWGTAKIINNLIFENKASAGGGISNYDTMAFQTQIINNTIVNNHANLGGGIINYGDSPVILNSIIYNNSAIMGSEIYDEEGLTIVNYSNVGGGWTGIGNINKDPEFVDPDNGDFHLDSCASPCINAGIDSLKINETWFYSPSTDIDNEARPYENTFPDIGADETSCLLITKIFHQETKSSTYLKSFPNLFKYQTTIEIYIQQTEFVRLSIIDFTGKEIQTLVSEYLQTGKHQFEWNSEGLPAGIYFIHLETSTSSIVQKVIILK